MEFPVFIRKQDVIHDENNPIYIIFSFILFMKEKCWKKLFVVNIAKIFEQLSFVLTSFNDFNCCL